MKGIYDSVVLARLIEEGKKAGKITVDQLNDALMEPDVNVEIIDEFYSECENLGIVIEDNSSETVEAPVKAEELSELIGTTNSSDKYFDFVKAYFNEMKNFPLLTSEEEKELGRIILQGNEEQRKKAKDQLITSNLRLVISLAKKYRGKSTESFLDVIQSGNIGLMKAADHYDYRKGYKFSTYATWWIKQAIIRAGFDNGRTIRIPIPVMVKIVKMKKAIAILENQNNMEPTNQQVADYMGIPVEKVRELMYYSQEPVSFETPIGEAEDSVLGDFIADPSYETPVEYASEKMLSEYLLKILEKELTEREYNVICLRMGFFDGRPRTLEEVGTLYRVTRERIRQIEAKALRKLRRNIQLKKIPI